MIHILGESALYLALFSAFFQTLIPFLSLRKQNRYVLALTPIFALCQFFFVLISFLLLVSAFLTDDFSIQYVAFNSHVDLPDIYKLTAAWGAHEGSVLFWVLVLAGWSVFFAKKEPPSDTRDLTLGILGILSLCFLSFVLYSSDPFLLAAYVPPQDLNPLLQDAGFVIHPPLLYIGYVGMCIPFAYTIASLMRKKIDSLWARKMRGFSILPWGFLTIGITLGSWWAYRVLGWGGFWFWDPVENASLLPWLATIALLHVLIIAEKKQTVFHFAVCLSILSFTLSVLGTFLVRSGILVSTHTFANDPKRGLFLLVLLALIVFFAVVIYLFQKKHIMTKPLKLESIYARETMLLLQAILLFTALLTVLLGTIYPLAIDSLQLGSISVGAPYFNTVLYPILLLTLFLMGFVPFTNWSSTKPSLWLVAKMFFLALFIGVFIAYISDGPDISNCLGISAVVWIFLTTGYFYKKAPVMSLAHAGFAILATGILLSATLSLHKEVSLRPGQAERLGPYQFFFIETQTANGSNYKGISGLFEVMKGKQHVTNLVPEKRFYTVREMVMTNVDIHPGIFRDLYIALGQPLDDGYWSIRLDYKPFIRWIWSGGFLMMLSCGLWFFKLREKR